jgi:tripartite-type tricarboxylate transporter receptor subunit TctC
MHRTLLAAALFALLVAPTAAQTWPGKPVKLVAPFPPGGGAETVGRPLAKVLAEQLGQPVVIEIRSGAGGTVGAEAVAKAAPDGYTFLIGSLHHVIAHVIYPHLAYDITRDLVPVVTVASMPNVVVVNPKKVPAENFTQFLQHLKTHPGRLDYASGGNGTTQHLTVELFKLRTNTFAVHIPYRGAGPALQDLLAGQVDFMFNVLSPTVPHIRSGRLKALAVTSSERSFAFPEVPTLAESGVSGADTTTWFGLFAPAGTPNDVITRMHGEVVKALTGEELRSTWHRLGMQAGGMTPAAMKALVGQDIARWSTFVKDASIKVD